jgi:hypothetical protein
LIQLWSPFANAGLDRFCRLPPNSNIHRYHAVAIREELLNGGCISSSDLLKQANQILVRNGDD